MAESVLILGAFFHRIQDEKVQESLLNLGVNIYTNNGELRDSYLILREMIVYLEMLWDNKEYGAFCSFLQDIVGKQYGTKFVSHFLCEDK